MVRISQILLSLILFNISYSQKDDWSDYKSEYLEIYSSMNIAALQLSYVENFKAIKGREDLKLQAQQFERMEKDLAAIDTSTLNPFQQLEHDYFRYFIRLNKERLALEQKWVLQRPDTIADNGIHLLNNSRQWYAYYLKRWLDLSVDVDSLYNFGLNEIRRAKSKIKALQIRSGTSQNDYRDLIKGPLFLISDADSVQQLFEDYAQWVTPKLEDHFPGVKETPPLTIARGTNKRLAQVPGYYSNDTFYYNLFDRPFDKKQAVFLYLHEALPGHHYEVSNRRNSIAPDLASYFNLPGYGEGWAAYVEEIAYELGLYPSSFDELGRWEWDLIRSVRVVLDIGLNYHGWSDEKALIFWQQHIENEDEIGKREIARMRRWPVQVITYKYGASKFLYWKSLLEEEPGFNLMEYHKKILRYGPVPFSIIEKLLLSDSSDE